MQTYTVRRPHQGDRWYDEGDTREANPPEVAHLVEKGVLVEVAAAPTAVAAEPILELEAKAEPPLLDKAEPPVRIKGR